MRYDYECNECGALNSIDVNLSEQPADWNPPQSIECSMCKAGKAQRVFGCVIGIANDSDETKHVGQSTSSSANLQFAGKGFPDADRKLNQEIEEIEKLMDEPPSKAEMAAGRQQMEELERDLGRQKGAISGDREMEDVEVVGVSQTELDRIETESRQSLHKTDSNKIAILADDAEAAMKHNLDPLAEGSKVVKHMAKRRGKEALAEEMRKNKAGR